MDKKLKSFVIATLRRGSYRWPGRYNALKQSKKGRNQYVCVMCPPDVLHGRKDVQLDHIVPVVDPVSGFTTWDDFINRLFVPESGFQVLCKACHDIKTRAEDALRNPDKDKKKLTRSKKRAKVIT